MKNLLRLTLGCLVLLTVFSCGCPPDEKVGDLVLSAETQGWMPYTGGETLQFSNGQGQTMLLENSQGIEEQANRLCVRTICTEAKIKGKSTCEYYSSQSKRFIFQSPDKNTLLDLLYYTEVYNPQELEFVDVTRYALSQGTLFGGTERVTSQRFNGPYDPDNISLMDPLISIDTLTLHGKFFSDVYADTVNNIKTYVTPGEGLIGFQAGTVVWALDTVVVQ